MNVHIKNIRLIDPFQGLDERQDIFIQGEEFVRKIEGSVDLYIDGSQLCASPGFIDAHTHLRDPGQTHKEDIISGTRAGAKGGYVCLAAMPNTSPVCDNIDIIRYIKEKSKNAYCEVIPVPAATLNIQGEELADYKAYAEHGVTAITNDGYPIRDAAVLYQVLKEAAKHDLMVIDHSEDSSLASGAAINWGDVSKKLKVKGMPNTAESLCVARDLLVAQDLNLPIHLCHISTEEGVALIRKAKEAGVKVTADVCPHHFCLTEEAVLESGANAKMYPPLRQEKDRRAIIEGLRDGTIDLIATDHAPHHINEKGPDLASAMHGIVGLETAFALSYTYLCLQEGFSLLELMKLLVKNPASLLKLQKRAVLPGNEANLCIFDINKLETVDAETFVSKSRNTPFNGFELTGQVQYTFWKGNLSYER